MPLVLQWMGENRRKSVNFLTRLALTNSSVGMNNPSNFMVAMTTTNFQNPRTKCARS